MYRNMHVRNVLLTYPTSYIVAIAGIVDDVVDGRDDGEEPAEEGEDLVARDGLVRVRLAPRKRVPWAC